MSAQYVQLWRGRNRSRERGAGSGSRIRSGERYPTAQCSDPAWVNVPTVRSRARPTLIGVRKYRSLVAWQRARALTTATLRATDAAYHPRARALFDQIRRAAISVEANIVEGYALGTPLQFRRHLRIALGSAAEAETLLEVAQELGYLQAEVANSLATLLDGTLRSLYGLVRMRMAPKTP